MDKRIEEKLIWMNVDPWDSYIWLAEHIIKLEDALADIADIADKHVESHEVAKAVLSDSSA